MTLHSGGLLSGLISGLPRGSRAGLGTDLRADLRACILAGVLACIGALPPALSQTIQRCEAEGGAITYSNEACPPGTRPVRAVQPPPPPSAQEQKTARTQVDKDVTASQQLEQQRAQQQAQLAAQQAEQRAVNCAYLRAEIDSVRRMRNMLTNRPYYSLDDLAQMDKHAAQLSADYTRVCSL